MGYLSCNAESAIATCDPHFTRTTTTTRRHRNTITEFHYTDLLAATNSFSAQTFLGKGSHGKVYKATLHNNHHVAVKTTKHPPSHSHKQKRHTTTCTGCGNCTSPAENEIEILSHVPSPRLVNLIGYCTDPNGNKLIVVEYMPNGSLHELLHKSARPPGWTKRIRFALQVAKAVQALHSSNPPVIHRDIKSSNVLIDGDWNARLGDFGLALRGHVEDVRVKCTPPAGTLGYLDPCYLAPGDLSAKSDVFSFGILLLEIISGRNAIDVNFSPPSVVDWAVPLIRRGDFDGICDRRIGTPSDLVVTRQVAVLAARCVRSSAERRPAMVEVVECLRLVRKRIHASPIWRRLRRRVARAESEKMKWEVYEGDCDGSEEVVRVVKSGNRRNRKVSSVPGVEYEGRPSSNKVVRSKSIGSGSVMRGGSSRSGVKNENEFRRLKGKMGMMRERLDKSHSMGVLQGEVLLHDGNEGIQSREMMRAMSKLVITDKLERKMLEKPLVDSYHWES
ncbi:serine/threonine-protein kinase-like protein At1g28390 [Lotus japonicus]|uniref:serine/threonine-protein kinase-like protein At1g28390 n=1 Tax=Lotus japonicus TaxID=34305 RepID=UPI0025899371|nr:serine/threonine-protein kinase-like protein At1g28390 [Lotus japonicus]